LYAFLVFAIQVYPSNKKATLTT